MSTFWYLVIPMTTKLKCMMGITISTQYVKVTLYIILFCPARTLLGSHSSPPIVRQPLYEGLDHWCIFRTYRECQAILYLVGDSR